MKKKRPISILFIIFMSLGIICLILMTAFAIWKKTFTSLSITALVAAILFITIAIFVLIINRNVNEPNNQNPNSKKIDDKNMTAICPHCGTENRGNQYYCKKCGHPLR